MLSDDPNTKAGIIAFLFATSLGVLAYVAATLLASFISPVPRRVYIVRLIFLTAFIVLIGLLWPAEAFSGSASRYIRSGLEGKDLGTSYGMKTWWVWFILALLKCPKSKNENAA